MPRKLIFLLPLILLSPPAHSHWCSNIYQTFARIVVKPDREQIDVAVGETRELKVRVRNNFPYTLHYFKLRANPPEGLSVTVSPDQDTAERIRVYAGQVLTFTLQITRDAEGSDEVSDLNLEINTTVESVGPGWRDSTDDWVDPDPAPESIRASIADALNQSLSLNYDKMANLNCPTCEQDGVQGLIDLWSSRIDPCNSSGFDDVWGMQFVRAGLHLAIRLRFRDFLDPSRQDVVQTMIAAMDDENDITRGLAAFLAAYGGNDPGVKDRIQAMADEDPEGICSFSPSPRAQIMAKSALLIMGETQYHPDVTACVDDDSEHLRARLVCAAALGITGEDAPMTDFLLQNTTDGKNTSNDGLYAGYLLQLVVYDRRGGPDGSGEATFLNEEPLPKEPDDSSCGCSVSRPGSSQGSCSGSSGTGLLFFLLLIPALIRPRTSIPLPGL